MPRTKLAILQELKKLESELIAVSQSFQDITKRVKRVTKLALSKKKDKLDIENIKKRIAKI